jgi:competence protein ComEA
VRPTSRSSDDADVIRARLRLLLDERQRPGGWLPDDDLEDSESDSDVGRGELGSTPAPWSTGPRPGPLPPPPEAPRDGLPQGLGRHRVPGAAVRLDPGRRGVWSLWLAGAVAAVLVVAWTWWQRPQVHAVPAASSASAAASIGTAVSAGPGRARPPTPITAGGPTPASPTALVVSVIGRVHHPGLVTLVPGARVADALAAAGGLLPGADAATVNLAAVVTDGQQIAVGVPGLPGDAGGQTPSTSAAGGAPVHLNQATAADLDGLPGIGPVLAQRIVDYRLQQGPFTSIDQLDDVPGIGPALFAQLRKRVTV